MTITTLTTLLLLLVLTFVVGGCGSDNTTTPQTGRTFHAIRGRITADSGMDRSGILLTVSPDTAIVEAMSTGDFEADSLPNGTYVVRPAKWGYNNFIPEERIVTIRDGDVEGVEFRMEIGVGMEMVSVEPGTFMMGAIPGFLGSAPHTVPSHRVTLTHALWVGKYEVTQEEYMALVYGIGNPAVIVHPTHPMNNVPVYEMMWFCNKLSLVHGYEPVYLLSEDAWGRTVLWNQDADGYRLPTEAEWEYFARAGTTGNTYIGNIRQADEERLDSIAWWRTGILHQGGLATMPVGLKGPNPWGIYDVIGNVAEVCFDNLRVYQYRDTVDPMGPVIGRRSNVCKGGSYLGPSSATSCVDRVVNEYPSSLPNVGFRVVRTKR